MLKRLSLLLLPVLITGAPAFAEEQQAAPQPEAVQSGYERFVDACSFCHGVNGKGRGDASHLLSKQPADLTQLAKDNDGKFPFRDIYDVIDGRTSSASHGERDMPVWGDLWSKSVPSEHADYYVRSRILEIMLYLESIQE